MDILKIAARVAQDQVEESETSVPQSETSVIRKKPGKNEWCVKSEKNPDWNGGCYPSKEKAEKRLKQVEYFKHNK